MLNATKSPLFVSDPPVITFRDFVIGERMEIKFNVINSGFQKNTFKIIGFDKEFQALFDIVFSPPGQIAPGYSTSVTLIFTPKYNSRIKCKLNCLTPSGSFFINVECIPRTIDIQIEPFDRLDMGSVVIGDFVEHKIVIRNTGALSATWTMSIENISFGSESGSVEDIEKIISFSVKHSSINGYSSSSTIVTFRPEAPTKISANLKFKFQSTGKDFDSFTKEIEIFGESLDVPVYVENPIINFGVCFYQEIYRQTLILVNRSDNSHHFNIITPNVLDLFVEFSPKIGFVQANSKLNVSIKARLTSKFTQYFPDNQDVVDIPLTINVVNQVIPVQFSISFIPSSTKISYSPNYIDFGTFATTEKSQKKLILSSSLQVPVNFGFVKLPPGVSVQPFDGYGILIPGEPYEVNVSFSSALAKRHEFEITMLALHGFKYSIKCSANIVISPLLLSTTTTEFEALPLGEESSTNLIITNTKMNQLSFEFSSCKDFYLDPVVGTIMPNESVSINIKFKPNIPLKVPDIVEAEMTFTKSSKSGREKRLSKSLSSRRKSQAIDSFIENDTRVIDPNFTYRLYDENLVCFWKSGQISGRHHITLRGASVLPTIFVTSVTVHKNVRKSEEFIDLSLRQIDFGVVAIGQSVDALVEIRSMSKHKLTISYFCECGSFEILSPARKIHPLKSVTVRVRFYPNGNHLFTSKAIIQDVNKPNSRITLELKGEGTAPSIRLSNDFLDFGHVLVGNQVTKSISVINDVSFELQYLYKLQPEDGMHHLNLNGKDAFNMAAKSEWIQPEQGGEASVIFAPDHDRIDFATVLVVSAGEDGQTREINVRASSWPFPMFVIGGIEEQKQITAFDHALLDEPYFRPNVICEMEYPGERSTCTLQIGCCLQGEDAKKSNGDFAFDNVNCHGFTITPQRATVEQGTTVQVQIEFLPSQTSVLQVGQWLVGETFLNLKCGDFSRKVPVKFKCLIKMQQNADHAVNGKTSKFSLSKKKGRK